MSYNEMSARYTELPEEFYVPSVETIGKQSTTNKQARDIEPVSETWAKNQIEVIQTQCENAFEVYHDLLAMDVPRELARSVLPVATYSHMFATVNLLNLFRFLTLRIDQHAQYEIRVYAEAMVELIRSVVPVCTKAWENNGNDTTQTA